MLEFDVVVIGGGPGGYVSAIRASQLGMKVALVEKDELGGVCLNRGCIPTKALIKNAEVLSLFKKAKGFGITYDNLRFDFKEAIKRSRRICKRLSKGIEYLMNKNNIAIIPGEARLSSARTVEVKDKEELKAKNIILALGSKPKKLPNIEIDGKWIITSNEALTLEELPESMIIMGGGPIGIEFAYLYNAFGTRVTLIEMLPNLFPLGDKEITDLLAKSLSKQGIHVMVGTKVEGVKVEGDGVRVNVSSKDAEKELEGEILLVAVGREPNVEEVGLEEVGIELDNGYIKVDERMETNVSGIYAIGDVIGGPLLAHVASAEGRVAVESMAGMKEARIDYGNIPNCIYCQPQLAGMGLTEDMAKQKGYEIKIGRFPFRASGMAQTLAEDEGLVKIVADAKYGEILGVHILGANATEIIAECNLAKGLEATTQEIARTIHAHPTLSEAIMEAAHAADGLAIHI